MEEAARLTAETGMNGLRLTPEEYSNGLYQLLMIFGKRAKQRLEATNLFSNQPTWYGEFLFLC